MLKRSLNVTLVGFAHDQLDRVQTQRLIDRFWQSLLATFGSPDSVRDAFDGFEKVRLESAPDVPVEPSHKGIHERWVGAMNIATSFAFAEMPGLDPGDECFIVDVLTSKA